MRLHRPCGFTLVEVLVALFIVAIGMAALFASMGSSADTAGYLRDKTFAQWIALNQLAQTRLASGNQLPSLGKTDGELDYAGRHWSWEQEVTQIELPGIVRVDVRVQQTENGAKPKDSNWMATVSTAVGDAVSTPMENSLFPDYLPPGVGGPGGTTPGTGQSSTNPASPANPTTGTTAPAPAPAPVPNSTQ